jgi:hypothetical protein
VCSLFLSEFSPYRLTTVKIARIGMHIRPQFVLDDRIVDVLSEFRPYRPRRLCLLEY